MYSSPSQSTSRIYIDITDDDENTYSNSEAEILAKCRREVSELRAQVHVLQKENSALKSKLDDTENILNATESELGRAVVANKRQVLINLPLRFVIMFNLLSSRSTILPREMTRAVLSVRKG